MNVIEIDALSKTFKSIRRSHKALDGLSLDVPEGGIFGFLGPNGSGKTTTIRCLLDLIRPTTGRTKVLGVETHDLHRVQNRIGSIVETPSFFPTFSAIQNLSHLGAQIGVGRSRALAVLENVGLRGREDDLFKNFSLGMKQRLGLAAALLKDPELLILDEPAHGLDPEGIRDIRVLIRKLGAEGRTIFLSSHLLSEVESMCDRVAIVSGGRLVASGPISEIISKLSLNQVIVVATDLAAAAQVLDKKGFSVSVESERLIVTGEQLDPAAINQTLARAKIFASEILLQKATLEDAYIQLREEDDS